MPAQLTYAPLVEYRATPGGSLGAARDLARVLQEREMPACYVRRDAGSDLEAARRVSAALLERGALPVVELHPGDPVSPLRNLGETICLGTLPLTWVDGETAFDTAKLLETADGAGRHRIPLDLLFDPGRTAPAGRGFKTFVSRLQDLAEKYGHIQAVKLMALQEGGAEGESEGDGAGSFEAIIDGCPKAVAAVTPSLWVNRSSLRKMASDLGGVVFRVEGAVKEGTGGNPLSAVEYLAGSLGIPVIARLPLTRRFFRKGWYAFEVGKALEAWVNRKTFQRYAERPAWLED